MEETGAQESTEQVEQTTDEAVESTPASAEQEVGWDAIEKALDTVPADQLRKHKRFAGILGGTLEQERRAWEKEQKAQAQAEAQERVRNELLDLARNDPIAFAERYQSDQEADRVRQQMESLRADTAKQYMHQIGVSYGQTFNLTDDDIAQISEALQGKSGDDILPTFNVAAAKIVTQREAQKLFNEWREKELPKEREALKQEIAANAMKGETTPSMRRSTPPSNVKPHMLPDDKFDEWYEQNVLRPGRTFTGR